VLISQGGVSSGNVQQVENMMTSAVPSIPFLVPFSGTTGALNSP